MAGIAFKADERLKLELIEDSFMDPQKKSLFSESRIHSTIKGRIAETISEWLFRELGFFVIKYGQEHALSPIAQLSDFVNLAGGSFGGLTGDIGQIAKLPDFVLVHRNGKVRFLEVKYRNDGLPLKINDVRRFFELYPHSLLLVINERSDAEKIWDAYAALGQEQKKISLESKYHARKAALSSTRFHVWQKNIVPLSLEEYFRGNDVVFDSRIIQKYEKILDEQFKTR